MRSVLFTAILGAAFLSLSAADARAASDGLEEGDTGGLDIEPFTPQGAHLRPLEAVPLNKSKKTKKKPKEPKFEDDYRYDFGERNLSFGIDVGGALANGITVNAFPVGGTVTPYFKGAFGDGNALQLDVTVGINPLNAKQSEWLFFRTPLLAGSAAYGFTSFIAPTLTFKYELELTSSISQRGRAFTWGGIGMGPMITYGQASLIDNGTLENTDLTNKQIFFDFVPTAGFKLRLGEFSYLELGARFHVLVQIASQLTGDTEWTTGTPEVIDEFWIGNSRYLDVFVGFSYDFR